MKNAPKLHRKDLLNFSSIARREEQPYFVFGIEELYAEEPHNELNRFIVSKELIGRGYGVCPAGLQTNSINCTALHGPQPSLLAPASNKLLLTARWTEKK
ncbi:MAG: hypothetical protein Q4F00_05430 [bacterium]|nr:hypothetical protein [bacterium]